MTLDIKYCRYETPPGLTERLLDHGWSVLLYDGNCSLCSGLVRFLADRSSHQLLAFCAMQSDAGRSALHAYYPDGDGNQTVLLLEKSQLLERSDVVLKVLTLMSPPWSWVGLLLKPLPKTFRDAVYRLVAVNRYHLFPRRDRCFLEATTHARRFIA